MELIKAIVTALIIATSLSGTVLIIMLLRNKVTTAQKQQMQYYLKNIEKIICLNFYNLLSKIIIFKIPLENFSYGYKLRYELDNTESKIKTSKSIFILIIVTVITLLVSLIYFDDTMLSIIMTIMAGLYTINKLKGNGIKFLESLEETIEDMVHLYNSNNNNIDQMFHALLQDRTNTVYRYMETMYETLKEAIINEAESESIIMQYNRNVPSRHLRIMFNYLYMTYRYGDELDERGEYLFNKNMLALQREVNADLMRVKAIRDGTIGEQWFIMLAIIMIPAATWYMKEFFTFENFETIGRFLDSTLGYTIKLICAMYSLICYYIYIKILDSNSTLEMRKSIYWEELVLKNKLINKVITLITPKRETVKYKKLSTKISMVEGYTGLKPFYLRKCLFGIIISIVVMLLLSFDTFLTYQMVYTDLYRGVNKETVDMIVSMEEFPEAYKAQAISNDDTLIQIIADNFDEYKAMTTDERKVYIQQLIRENNIDYGIYPEIAVDRIMEKVRALDKINPEMIVLILIGVGLLGYMLPNIALTMTLILNRKAMVYDEVMGYYTVVMLLINHPTSNIYMLLTWIKNFADIFKVRFQECLDNISEQEILNLKEAVNYKPLARLVESILIAYRGADLKSAFAGVEQRHQFQEESRRILNQKIIAHRITCSEMLTWSAMGITFILYILVPMCYAIMEMLKEVL